MTEQGSDMPATPVPTNIIIHRASHMLELRYADDRSFQLPFEYLRVYSPSAEVRGHGPGQWSLQTDKREVTIDALDPVGHYAIQPRFSDGHMTGIYSWDYLYELATHYDSNWQAYLDQLAAAGVSRDTPMK